MAHEVRNVRRLAKPQAAGMAQGHRSPAAGALPIGKRNHHLHGLTSDVRFLPHDIFHSWGKIIRGGRVRRLPTPRRQQMARAAP